MCTIKIERATDAARLKELGVSGWPVWTKEASEFPWRYNEDETCYFLEGDVTVTPAEGDPVQLGKGALAAFPKGMARTWKIRKTVRKHYRFGWQARHHRRACSMPR